MNPPHLYIITGASRGLGLALARQLAHGDHALLCLARHDNADLAAQAQSAAIPLEQWSIDLNHGREAAAMLRQWLGRPRARYASATLINNAGMIPRVAPLGEIDPDELAQAVRVNLEAPMALSAAFLGATAGWDVPRRLLNISSGLGRRPMAAQVAYCATKAGIDLMTRCIALEEAGRPNPARVCSLAPGVVDTDMQAQLRSATAADFPDRQRFEHLHSEGLLASPEQTARQIIEFLARSDFGMQVIADIRD